MRTQTYGLQAYRRSLPSATIEGVSSRQPFIHVGYYEKNICTRFAGVDIALTGRCPTEGRCQLSKTELFQAPLSFRDMVAPVTVKYFDESLRRVEDEMDFLWCKLDCLAAILAERGNGVRRAIRRARATRRILYGG